MSAEYWIVQHIADLFRNEPRNVGVIVRVGGQNFARFFGEDSEQRLDGRRIKALPYPDVYRQWVQYWRSNLGNVDGLVRVTRDHYRIERGGMVSDVNSQDVYSAADNLYSVLVSDGGIAEALTAKEEIEAPGLALEHEIERAFSERALLARDGLALIRNPIRREAVVPGRIAEHRPAFSQMNGHLCVIESVDLTSPRKRTWRDHSGFIAYMFRDIADNTQGTERVTLLRSTPEDIQSTEGEYALRVLRNESSIVEWTDAGSRDLFLSQRAQAANS